MSTIYKQQWEKFNFKRYFFSLDLFSTPLVAPFPQVISISIHMKGMNIKYFESCWNLMILTRRGNKERRLFSFNMILSTKYGAKWVTEQTICWRKFQLNIQLGHWSMCISGSHRSIKTCTSYSFIGNFLFIFLLTLVSKIEFLVWYTLLWFQQ